jgi:hypothetical protein
LDVASRFRPHHRGLAAAEFLPRSTSPPPMDIICSDASHIPPFLSRRARPSSGGLIFLNVAPRFCPQPRGLPAPSFSLALQVPAHGDHSLGRLAHLPPFRSRHARHLQLRWPDILNVAPRFRAQPRGLRAPSFSVVLQAPPTCGDHSLRRLGSSLEPLDLVSSMLSASSPLIADGLIPAACFCHTWSQPAPRPLHTPSSHLALASTAASIHTRPRHSTRFLNTVCARCAVPYRLRVAPVGLRASPETGLS